MFSKLLLTFFTLFLVTSSIASPVRVKRCRAQTPSPPQASGSANTEGAPSPQAGCFPSAGFNPPSVSSGQAPNTPLDSWWCDRSTEYAFMGFSYPVNDCPSKSQMTTDFNRMQSAYGARYVRMYAACDNDGFYDDVVEAAYNAGIGVYSLVWFGFNGDDSYKGRLSSLLSTIENNPLAPYTIRTVTIGSEPCYDSAVPTSTLVSLVQSTISKVGKFGIQVSVSDMVAGWNKPGCLNVLNAVQHVESNTLPFFNGDATNGGAAWPDVTSDIDFYHSHASGKKIILAQTGWPSNQDVWQANSRSAVASVGSEQSYYKLLNSKCSTFKSGGIGWFWHVYDDDTLPGWGLLDNGNAKFSFNPSTSC